MTFFFFVVIIKWLHLINYFKCRIRRLEL